MQKLFIIGRLTADPEQRVTPSGISVCSFTVAVDRRFPVNGEMVTDFYRVNAWRQLGDNCAKYLSKGKKVAVVGSGASAVQLVPAIVDEVRLLDDAAFLALLQKRFGTRHRFVSATPRVSYPLGLRYRPDPVGARPHRSRPASASGMVASCTSKGSRMFWARRTATRSAGTPRSAKVDTISPGPEMSGRSSRRFPAEWGGANVASRTTRRIVLDERTLSRYQAHDPSPPSEHFHRRTPTRQ